MTSFRSRSRSFLSLLSLAAASCLAFAVSAAHRVVHAFAVVALHVVNVLASPAKMEGTGLGAPQRLLLAAQSFHARIVKRERPSIQGNWRMCPSC